MTELTRQVRIGKIESVDFAMFSPQQIKKLSVVHVTETSPYMRNFPRANGVNDLRMGTTDRRFHCSTCKNDIIKCSGHLGHIDLAEPVYHTGFFPIIIKMLRCVCFMCSRLKVMPEDLIEFSEMYGSDKLNTVSKFLTTKLTCVHCQGPQPLYKRVGLNITVSYKPKQVESFESPEEAVFCTRPFTPRSARSILKHLSDEDCMLLGLNPSLTRPEWMVLTVLIVPPPIIRPSIMASDGSKIRGQDDLTTKLQEIIKVNNSLRVATTDKDRQNLWDQLQAHVAMFVYRDVKAMSIASNKGTKVNRKLRMIFDRFKGKRGRIRGNLQGKRVNYSARSVVSPDPIMDIDLVGVPQELAMRLSVPVKVAPFNLEEMTRCVRYGADHPKGAACIVLEDQTVIDLKLMKDTSHIKLELGWTVERFLQNNDWVMFNRQPSLHKMSIMAHKVQIIPGKSFRLSLCNTTPYNADFDGDEMNIHALRTLPATAELEGIMAVKHQIISPQSNKPIIGLVIDSVVSGYLMTRRDSFFTKEEACQIVMGIHYPQRSFLPDGTPCALTNILGTPLPLPAILKPVPLWTGKQLFSLIFPKLRVSRQVNDAVEHNYNKFLEDGEGYVQVSCGELLCGALCKKMLGTSSGGLIHVIYNDFGPDEAVNFISDAQRILVNYMVRRGFSVGIADCLIGQEPEDNISRLLKQTKEQGLLVSATDEEGQAEALNTKLFQGILTNTFSLVQPTLQRHNALLAMSRSGAKGSAINIAQICGCVGQQSIGGRRVQPGRNGRTLSSFLPKDIASQARGFVENSYITGLNAEEYFFHAMGGREGLVDTAVKTASTGYIQRRMMKAMESLKVAYDNTVRDARNKIIQFAYGGNSFDAARVERIGMKLLSKSNSEIQERYGVNGAALRNLVLAPFTLEESCRLEHEVVVEVQAILVGRDVVRAGRSKLSMEMTDTVYLPVNMQRLFERSLDHWGQPGRDSQTHLHPLYVVAKRNQLYSEIVSLYGANESAVLRAYIRSTFSLRDIYLGSLGVPLSKEAFDWMCEVILKTCVRAHVVPGEMVGAVGASSIGEPTTQMTLNTFHYSGVASKDVTLGMPRLKELIDAVPNIRTPSMTIRFPSYATVNKEWVSMFVASLECVQLNQVVDDMEVLVEPDYRTVSLESKYPEDAFAVYCFMELHGDGRRRVGEPVTQSDSILRYTLNKTKLQKHCLLPVHIARAIQNYLGDKVEVVYADAVMKEWFLRLRFKGLLRTSDDLYAVAIKEVHDHMMEMLKVHGNEAISRVILHEERQSVVNPVTGEVVNSQQWTVDTQGSCFQDVLGMKGVDFRRCVSNDVNEVTHVLGIEAGAQMLKMEITNVLSFDGTYVNEHNIKLLVDTMTHEGTLQPMTRHGITKVNGGTFQRASFEETMEVFLEAAAFASTDTVSGVTENIMLGKLAPVGTAAFDLVCPASALGGSLGASASDVQQFIPKSKKVNALFYDKQQQQAVSEKRKPAVLNLTTTGPMTVAAMDMDDSDEHDDQDDLDDLESVAARDVAMSDAQQFKEEEMRSLEDELCGYMPSSPVWLAMTPDYVPTSPKYY
jgi:DNA-directed RNA polymerase II subunit RPB1